MHFRVNTHTESLPNPDSSQRFRIEKPLENFPDSALKTRQEKEFSFQQHSQYNCSCAFSLTADWASAGSQADSELAGFLQWWVSGSVVLLALL